MKKYILRIPVQSFSDIVTNSSSELFVFTYGTTDFIRDQLNQWAPGWEEEYEPPILFSDMSENRQKEYIDWVFDIPHWDSWSKQTIADYNKEIIRYVSRELCISDEEVPTLFENWNQVNRWKTPDGRTIEYYSLDLSDKAYELLKNKYRNDICLWSYDENPNWDRQECIMYITHAKRYHLG